MITNDYINQTRPTMIMKPLIACKLNEMMKNYETTALTLSTQGTCMQSLYELLHLKVKDGWTHSTYTIYRMLGLE